MLETRGLEEHASDCLAIVSGMFTICSLTRAVSLSRWSHSRSEHNHQSSRCPRNTFPRMFALDVSSRERTLRDALWGGAYSDAGREENHDRGVNRAGDNDGPGDFTLSEVIVVNWSLPLMSTLDKSDKWWWQYHLLFAQSNTIYDMGNKEFSNGTWVELQRK